MSNIARVHINNIYIDPYIEYNINTIYRCFPQGSTPDASEKLGVPLRNTFGIQVIYDSQHMCYKSIAFMAAVMDNGRAFPALKCVLAPIDGVLKMVNGRPSMETNAGILVFDKLSKPMLGAKKKGQVIGEVSPVPNLNGHDGIIMTCYASLNGSVIYLPDYYYNIPMIE